jgi:hypothetical protein
LDSYGFRGLYFYWLLCIAGVVYLCVHLAILCSDAFAADLRNALLDEKDYLFSAGQLILSGEYAACGGQPALLVLSRELPLFLQTQGGYRFGFLTIQNQYLNISSTNRLVLRSKGKETS